MNQGHFNDVNWTWGGQVTVGYRFGCGCDWAVEGTYWGLAESNSDGGPGIPGPYVIAHDLRLDRYAQHDRRQPAPTATRRPTSVPTARRTITSGGTTTPRTWNSTSCGHSVGGECNRFDVDFLAGVRWFRFQDGFVFGAEAEPTTATRLCHDWLYLNDHITNDLVGGQVGFNASYRFADCWKVFVRPKFGVYNNHMTLDYNLYAVSSTTAQQYQASSQTYANPNYPVHATTDGFAFLTQVDLGLDWQITRHVSTQFGYRVVAVTGMGLSDSQIPFYANDTQAIADIQHNDSLILHGAFGGLTFTW